MNYKNNPLNIRATDSKWIGACGKKNGFLEFTDVVYGVRCGIYLLRRTYKRWFGYCSLEKCIYTFAPSSENDTESYITFIVKETGIPRGTKVWFMSRDMWYRLLKAMCKIESNYNLSRETSEKAYKLV